MAERAPRLGPQERIASFITRRGRFRRVDPLRTRPPIGVARLLGVLGWVVLVEESFRRARRAVAADAVAVEVSGVDAVAVDAVPGRGTS